MQLKDIIKQEEQLEINKNFLIEHALDDFNKYQHTRLDYLFYIVNGSDKWGAQDEILEIQKVIPDAEWLIGATDYDGIFSGDLKLISPVKKIVEEPSTSYTCNRLCCYKSKHLEGYEIAKYDVAILCVRKKDIEALNTLFKLSENGDDYKDNYKKFIRLTENMHKFSDYDISKLNIYERAGYYTAGNDFNLTIGDLISEHVK